MKCQRKWKMKKNTILYDTLLKMYQHSFNINTGFLIKSN